MFSKIKSIWKSNHIVISLSLQNLALIILLVFTIYKLSNKTSQYLELKDKYNKLVMNISDYRLVGMEDTLRVKYEIDTLTKDSNKNKHGETVTLGTNALYSKIILFKNNFKSEEDFNKNKLRILYHELGHTLIAGSPLSHLGQEIFAESYSRMKIGEDHSETGGVVTNKGDEIKSWEWEYIKKRLEIERMFNGSKYIKFEEVK